MKRPEQQIFQFLSGFPGNQVKEGFKLWNLAQKHPLAAKKILMDYGWSPAGEKKPQNRESLFLFGEYWVQAPEEHIRQAREKLKEDMRARRQAMTREMAERKEWNEKAKKCPECGAAMMLYEVPFPKGPRNLYGYKTLWQCRNQRCLFEEYSEWDLETALKAYGLSKFMPRRRG